MRRTPLLAILAVAMKSCTMVHAVEVAMEPRTLWHDGIEREYFVHMPDGSRSAEQRLPLVVAIHGYTDTATGFQVAHGLNRHANEHGYAVVYPQGTHFMADGFGGSEPIRITSWNDLAANMPETPAGPHCSADSARYPCPPECGSCLRCAWASCHDDLGFLAKMLDDVQQAYPVDPGRTYALGVSNGAMMALRLGCEISDRFAAIAPIVGQLAPGYACGPTTNLPMLHLFGGKDETVRYDGKAGADDGFIYTSAAETARVWAEALQCDSGPSNWSNSIVTEAALQCTAYSGCRVRDSAVVSCMDPDETHNWPQQGVTGIPATCITAEQSDSMPGQAQCGEATGSYSHLGMDLIWDFFSRYRLQDPVTD